MKNDIIDEYNTALADQIAQAMKKKHISLEYLSKLTGNTIPKPTLARYVRGENTIPDERLSIICKALNLNKKEMTDKAAEEMANKIAENKYGYLIDPDWQKELDDDEPVDLHIIDPTTLTREEARMIGYYRAALSSVKKAVRLMLGMDE